MLRTRLLCFTAGFSLTGAAIGQFLWKDLWSDRYALSADVTPLVFCDSFFFLIIIMVVVVVIIERGKKEESKKLLMGLLEFILFVG